MFKDKFKELVLSKEGLAEVSFEILNDEQASALLGGCKVLGSCGQFTGSCDNLTKCTSFVEVPAPVVVEVISKNSIFQSRSILLIF